MIAPMRVAHDRSADEMTGLLCWASRRVRAVSERVKLRSELVLGGGSRVEQDRDRFGDEVDADERDRDQKTDAADQWCIARRDAANEERAKTGVCEHELDRNQSGQHPGDVVANHRDGGDER